MINGADKRVCCGCQACAQVCPTHAIGMFSDEEGFIYPKVTEDMCVHCNLCERVCPFNSSYVDENADPDVYAAVNKESEICKKSSSGGVFSAVSDWILQKNGVVYGVKFETDFRVIHASATLYSERNCFRGSKYVQSDTNRVYQMVEADLKNRQMVLFTGTPCQVEALNRYLKVKSIDTEKLYTIDNICHGVASPRVWEDYIKLLEKQLESNEQISYINMRGKDGGWRNQEMVVRTDKRDLSQFINKEFSWNRLYRTLYITRSSCYSCKFTSYKRPSDLTLADFWNFENAEIDLDDTNGISLVLVNSEKGKYILDQVVEQLQIAKSDKKRCWQIHLEFPNNAPNGRGKFWKEYWKKGANKALKKYTKGSLMNRFIRKVSPILRKLGLYTIVAKVHHMIGKR